MIEIPTWGVVVAVLTVLLGFVTRQMILPAQRRRMDAQTGTEEAGGAHSIVESVGMLTTTLTGVLQVIQGQRDAALARVAVLEIDVATLKQELARLRAEYADSTSRLTEVERKAHGLFARNSAKLPRPKR